MFHGRSPDIHPAVCRIIQPAAENLGAQAAAHAYPNALSKPREPHSRSQRPDNRVTTHLGRKTFYRSGKDTSSAPAHRVVAELATLDGATCRQLPRISAARVSARQNVETMHVWIARWSAAPANAQAHLSGHGHRSTLSRSLGDATAATKSRCNREFVPHEAPTNANSCLRIGNRRARLPPKREAARLRRVYKTARLPPAHAPTTPALVETDVSVDLADFPP